MLIREKTDEEIVKEYKNLVYKICRRVYNNCSTVIDRNMLDIEDFVQWGYVALINAKNTYKESSGVTFINYASACISNRLRAEYIRPKQVKTYLLLGNASLDVSMTDKESDGTIGDMIGVNDIGIEGIELLSCLEKIMSIEELELFIQHYVNGYSMKEIAKDYNCTPSYISIKFRNMKKKIEGRMKIN